MNGWSEPCGQRMAGPQGALGRSSIQQLTHRPQLPQAAPYRASHHCLFGFRLRIRTSCQALDTQCAGAVTQVPVRRARPTCFLFNLLPRSMLPPLNLQPLRGHPALLTSSLSHGSLSVMHMSTPQPTSCWSRLTRGSLNVVKTRPCTTLSVNDHATDLRARAARVNNAVGGSVRGCTALQQ